MDPATIGLIAALAGSAGVGVLLKDTLVSLFKYLSGMSARESSRKKDIVTEREEAVARAEMEAKNRRILEEALAEQRRKMIVEFNIPQSELDPWPDYDHTLPAEKVRKIRGTEPT